MTPDRLSDFLPLAAQSLSQPRVILRKILSINVPRQDVILAGWVVIVLGLVTTQLLTVLLRAPTIEQPGFSYLISGVLLAIVSVFGGGFLMFRMGQYFGGTGNLDDSLRTVIWLNFILIFLQIPIPVSVYLWGSPINLVTTIALVFTFIQAVSMTMELHGFTKVFPVLLGILGAQFLLGVVALFVFQFLGIGIAPLGPVS